MFLLMFRSILKSSKIAPGGSPSISQEATVEYKWFFFNPNPKKIDKRNKIKLIA